VKHCVGQWKRVWNKFAR